MTRREEGPLGSAVKLVLPDIPEASETVCHWLITAPAYHPLWSQYVLVVVRLRDVPGLQAPVRHFQGATHELLVVVLDPEFGPHGEDIVQRSLGGEGFHYLTPVNISHQLEGTDGEAESLAGWAVKGIVHGALNPETADAPDRVRADWKTSLVKTLAHIRGEEHAP